MLATIDGYLELTKIGNPQLAIGILFDLPRRFGYKLISYP